jgi:hypothetical protein
MSMSAVCDGVLQISITELRHELCWSSRKRSSGYRTTSTVQF